MGKEVNQRGFFLAVILILGAAVVASSLDPSITGQAFSFWSWFGGLISGTISNPLPTENGCECLYSAHNFPSSATSFTPCKAGVCEAGTCSVTYVIIDDEGKRDIHEDKFECWENSEKKECGKCSADKIAEEGVRGAKCEFTGCQPPSGYPIYYVPGVCPGESTTCNTVTCTAKLYVGSGLRVNIDGSCMVANP